MENIKKLDSNTVIIGLDDHTVKDFWQWAYSDILSNRNRSIYGEFLVASALNITATPRVEWNYYDLKYENLKIEIKTSAYLQSWHQNKLSNISFDISKKKAWYPETNTYSEDKGRFSDLFVFCLYKAQNHSVSNILDTSLWEFYILETVNINKKLESQKSIGINRLKSLALPLEHKDLKAKIDLIKQNY